MPSKKFHFTLVSYLLGFGCLFIGLLSPERVIAFEDLPSHTPLRVGLVLGGGGARGLAHIGVLKALQEARVPLSCVVGTSIGALVGAAFATGRTPEEIDKMTSANNWPDMFSGTASRDKLAYRQKRNDLLDLAQFEMGVNDKTEVLLPKAAVSTQKIALFLREMTMGAVQPNFDYLATPFRAIAANIEDGSMEVLDDGDLVNAMLASMAVPTIFPAVELRGKHLVDGGIARNLPIDVARHTCADVVIAVNVGDIPLRAPKIDGIFSTADQLTRILIIKNVQPQLASLTDKDILIEPKLDNFGGTEFKRSKELIELGYTAAKAQLEKLKPHSVSPKAYQNWLDEREKKRPQAPIIEEITVAKVAHSHVTGNVLKERLGVKIGKPLEIEKFSAKLETVYASTDLEQLGYELIHRPQGSKMKITPVEKSWGPNYLTAGIGLRTDLNGHNGFILSGLYRRTWVNSLGAEWKTLLQVGENRQIYTEFYQPLVEDDWAYIAPFAFFKAKHLNVYQENGLFNHVYTSHSGVGIDFGSSVSRFGEFRLGVSMNRYNQAFDGGLQRDFNSNMTARDFGARTSLHYDQLDNVYFPSSGNFFQLSGYRSLKAIDGQGKYTKLSIKAIQALRFGQLRSLCSIHAEHVSNEAPLIAYSQLGGLFNLSSYPYKELLGRGKALAKVQIYYPVGFLTDFSERANYIGASFELGKVFHMPILPGVDRGNKYSYSLYWATDTPLGPFYLAYARGDNHQNRVYLMLGSDF